MNRRQFLQWPALLWPLSIGCASRLARDANGTEMAADVVIVGGGLGGVAAALAACESGCRVILTEETDWVGGQSTAQGVPPDEHPWIEEFGCARSYRRYREAVRQFYRDHRPLIAAARANPRLNPGNGWVSRLCHEPAASLAVLEAMLEPHLTAGRLRVLLFHAPVAATTDRDHVRSVTVQDHREGTRRVLVAPFFIDATELGDLLPLTGAEFVTGSEARRETGEPHAPGTARPDNQQACTFCLAIEHLPGECHVADAPPGYAFWRHYVPRLTPPWPGPLLSWRHSHPVTLEPRELPFDPTEKAPGANLWTYRRLRDPAVFEPGFARSSVSLVNWPQNDYWLAPLVAAATSPTAGATPLHSPPAAEAAALSRCLLHWMQTEAPRPDGGVGWPGLRPATDVFGTADGLAKSVYVREARRIRAEFTVCEQHIGTEARQAETGLPRETVRAAGFEDSVGIGAYRVDLHPTTGGDNYVDFSSLPFQIPLGALLPQRIENLLPAAKNIGTTHLTNGAYRLHPVEWNIGEAAGALAAFALRRRESPRHVRDNPRRLAEFQALLVERGVELAWPAGIRPL
ncbi:MAG: FAD-dependent oxidoreductase [Verrucomicrobiales bacterium]|nr:FAD-dependent oxidoreductase [Verrucomicrobiales bacterium]